MKIGDLRGNNIPARKSLCRRIRPAQKAYYQSSMKGHQNLLYTINTELRMLYNPQMKGSYNFVPQTLIMASKNQEQQHPQERLDRPIVDQLLQSEPNDLNLAECARLRIRYQNFPGAREIQRDLDLILEKWQLDEASLWAKTRPLHSHGQVYQIRQTEEQQDWS